MAAKGKRNLRQETVDAVRAKIASGELKPGDRVGRSLDALTAQYHVGKGTVRAAIEALAADGLVETIPGKGTFVLEPPREAVQSSDPAEILKRLTAVEMDVMEIYARTGHEQPSHQQNGRKARHEQAG